jgi:hypothetical protein
MKKAIVFLAMILMATPVTAEQWIIEGSGDDVQMRPRYDYDYSRRYKGEIEDDGYTRLRNPYTGERLRGYIEDDGYGYLRDHQGLLLGPFNTRHYLSKNSSMADCSSRG